MKKVLLIVVAVLLSVSTYAQEKITYSEKDVEIFNDYRAKFIDKHHMPIGRLIMESGKYFLGTPYVGYTLEVKEPEELIINLSELDCVTFVENSIALAQTIKSDTVTFENYCNHLRNLRYRDGVLKDFTSRLHYFSDWISNKESMGIMDDITEELGGEEYPIAVNLMSKYPKNYRQLVNNPDYIPVIAAIEDSINKRVMYSIGRDKADELKRRLKNGYIIGTTTPGMMDVTHVGIVCVIDGVAHFMHASSTAKEVVISEGSLEDYLKSVKTMTGFMVARVREP